jgi:hypothetical protein
MATACAGLQNRWTALRVVGGFDSRPPPLTCANASRSVDAVAPDMLCQGPEHALGGTFVHGSRSTSLATASAAARWACASMCVQWDVMAWSAWPSVLHRISGSTSASRARHAALCLPSCSLMRIPSGCSGRGVGGVHALTRGQGTATMRYGRRWAPGGNGACSSATIAVTVNPGGNLLQHAVNNWTSVTVCRRPEPCQQTQAASVWFVGLGRSLVRSARLRAVGRRRPARARAGRSPTGRCCCARRSRL